MRLPLLLPLLPEEVPRRLLSLLLPLLPEKVSPSVTLPLAPASVALPLLLLVWQLLVWQLSLG